MSDWISIEDRLPEIGDRVLWLYDCGFDDEHDYDYHISMHNRKQGFDVLIELGITHWMPLPAPPEVLDEPR